MPFQKGVATPGAGRKGYEYEKEQMETMTKQVNKYLAIIDRLLDGKETKRDYSVLMAIGADLRKILDKIHASKTENKTNLTGQIEEVIKTDKQTQEFINEFKNWRKSKL